MKNLGDTQWIIAKTAERKPIKELENYLNLIVFLAIFFEIVI